MLSMSKYDLFKPSPQLIGQIQILINHYSMKHDAIVEQGIPIYERVPIPDEMIPEDSRVEIDAKIHSGYCELLYLLLRCLGSLWSFCSYNSVTLL